MPRLERGDGVELHWEKRGEGPLVILAPYWSGHPGVFEDLLGDLARDHEVVTYDARGTGSSTGAGPYDMATDCADLEAVIDAMGSDAVLLALADGANRTTRVGAARPDLVAAVITLGTPPLDRGALGGADGMIASDTVVEAFFDLLETDLRPAMRTVLRANNPQMEEEELGERVRFQVDYSPLEPTLARVRAWAQDDPLDAARELGGRLWILAAEDTGGPWLPPRADTERLIAKLLPDARMRRLEAGPLSRPDLTADMVRQVRAELRSGRARA